MPDALEVVTQRMRLRSRSNDEYVTCTLTPLKAAVERDAIRKAPHAQRNRHQSNRDEHNLAGNVFGPDQVKGSREQQTRGEAGLQAPSLLVEDVIQLQRRIELQPPADDDQGYGESAHQRQQDSHRTVLK